MAPVPETTFPDLFGGDKKSSHLQIAKHVGTHGPLWFTVHASLWSLDRFVEFILYPLSILVLGPIFGIGAMMVVSFFLCWALIVFYDHVSEHWLRDALGFETLKGAGTEGRAWVKEHLKIDVGGPFFKVILFLYLSIRNDPMTTLIILRPRNHHRMGAKEWRIFIGSVIISCVGWGLIVIFLLDIIRTFIGHWHW